MIVTRLIVILPQPPDSLGDFERCMDTMANEKGFSLLELIVAMGLALVVLGGALHATIQSAYVADVVSQRSDMQQNARVAINMIVREVSLAGTGFPANGIQLPSGNGSQDSKFACDSIECHVISNVYTNDRLNAVLPAPSGGPTINGMATDAIVMVSEDQTSSFDQFLLVDVDAVGKKLWFDPATVPAYNDPAVGLKPGDVILLNNANGQAAATITDVLADGEVWIMPGNKDPLDLNQQGMAASGTFMTIAGPPTSARRINVTVYYLDNSDPNTPLLMRQVNAHPPTAVAEFVENLQVTYDIFDFNTSVGTSDLDDAGGVPNMIRKVNVSVSVRSAKKTKIGEDFQRTTLTTSVGPRNLTYKDRYE